MGELLNRFDGEGHRARLLEAVLNQKLVANDASIAEAFVSGGELREFAPGEVLITQGEWDDDVYLLLAGDFDVVINGRPQATRSPGEHVGELSGIDASQPRSATVKAHSEGLALKLSQGVIEDAAKDNTAFWRRVSKTVASRLEERNKGIGKTNDIPRVFVISSSESLPIVEQIVLHLDSSEIAVDTWDKGTFGVSDYPISSLMDAIEACDFTISVVKADDLVVSRGKEARVARDNVHLEYGISLGVLGRRRSILMVCADDNVELPTDASGLTTLRFRSASDDEMRRTIRTACLKAKEHVLAEGVFVDRRGG